jgi:hypothetical protein
MEDEGKKLATFLELSDRINQTLWQVDNSKACGIGSSHFYEGFGDVDDILALLVKYGLIFLDVPTKPASLNEIFAIADENIHWNSGPADMREYMIRYAFEERRWDILAAFEIGKNPPVDRKAYWKQYYSERLGKVNIDYWEWLANPESLEFCPELTDLLSLPVPSQDARLVLQVLPEGKDPFFKIETKPGEIPFSAFLTQGKFANWEPQRKQEARSAFREWHFQALSSLGREKLEAIYKTCYKVGWSLIEGILYTFHGDWWEVLGISPNSTLADAKKAFRKLAKIYHPDAGGDIERMRSLNRAMELAEKAFETSKYKVNKRYS